MKEYARSLSECRSNVYRIYPLDLLQAAGSRRVASDKWELNFTIFDKLVDFLLDSNIIKKFAIDDIITPLHGKELCAIGENGETIMIDSTSPEAELWLKEYLSALYVRIVKYGGRDRWLMHIQDEPCNASTWIRAKALVEKYMPDIPCGNPFSTSEVMTALKEHADLYIPIFNNAENKKAFLEEILKRPDKEVWGYCCFPDEDWYLNRFIDKPHIHSRLIAWATYSHGFTGYLHYGYSFWRKTDQFYPYGVDKYASYKGDCMMIYPSPQDNSYKISSRYINIRDGAQDYELLKIVEKNDKEKAKHLAASVARGYMDFDEDEGNFTSVRRALLEAAEESAAISSG